MVGQYFILQGSNRESGKGGPLGPSPASPLKAGLTSSRLLRVLPGQVWHISQDGDFSVSLDNLFEYCLAILAVKKCLVVPNLNFPCINFWLLLLLLPLCASEKGLAPSSLHPPLGC